MVFLTPKRIKIIKTLFCYVLFICMGSIAAIPGPTLTSLEEIIDGTKGKISQVFIFRPLGSLIGSFLGGLVLDRVSRTEPILLCLGCGMSVASALVPFCNSKETLFFVFFVIGLFLQSFNAGINVVFLNLWPKHEPSSAGAFQGLHFAFGVGALLAPVIAEPYLAKGSAIKPIYIIISVNTFVVLALFAVFTFYTWQLKQQRKQNPETDDDSQQEAETPLPTIKPIHKYIIIAILIFAVFSAQAIEVTVAQAIATIAEKSLKLSKAESSQITSSFWAPYMLIRLVATLTLRKIDVTRFIVFDLVILLIAALVMIIGGTKSTTALWAGTILIGTGIGTLFPATISWVSRHLEITFFIGALFFVVGSASEMSIPHLLMSSVEADPKIYNIFALTTAVTTAILFILLASAFRKFAPISESPRRKNENKIPERQTSQI